jgi:hypothetical protein
MSSAPLHPAVPRSLAGLAFTFAAIAASGAETSPRARLAEDPYGGSGAAVLEPVPAPSPQPTRRLVFSCITPGLVTFSDRPCGPAQQLYEIRLLPPHATQPGEAASLAKSKPSTSPRAPHDKAGAADAVSAAAAKAAEHTRACERLEEAVQTLDRRMRAGYSSSEAPRLWDRWRDAKERLRQADC